MEIGHLIPHIEALIFASDKPLTGLELTDLINNAFGFMEDKIVLDQVESALEGIVEKYRSEFYPFEVKESGGGWQFLTKRDYHKTVAQLNGEKFLKRLSTAALEALSIVAYKQPVTKAEIEAIRGVSSDYAIQKLLEKELIVITGRNENLPGHPLVYATSKNFMDYFGINSAEDLPKLKEVFDEAMVDATNVNDAIAQEVAVGSPAAGEEDIPLAVAENGALITGGAVPHLNGEAVEFTPDGEESTTGDLAGEEAELDNDEELDPEETGDEAIADEEAGEEDEGEEVAYEAEENEDDEDEDEEGEDADDEEAEDDAGEEDEEDGDDDEEAEEEDAGEEDGDDTNEDDDDSNGDDDDIEEDETGDEELADEEEEEEEEEASDDDEAENEEDKDRPGRS